jgi:hypothetical protein
MDGLRDIQGQINIPPGLQDYLYPVAVILGAVIILSLIVILFIFFMRRVKARPARIKRDPLLDSLNALAGLEKTKCPPEKFYRELSWITRGFLQDVLELPAYSSSTSEIIKALGSRSRSQVRNKDLVNQARTLFLECDLAKFAGYNPEPAEMTRALEKARRLIRSAVPPQVEL